MTHTLARILPPPVFGVTVWLCRCGHRSFTETERQRHEEESA